MTLHPLAERFADVAAEYERGRPEYPPAVAGVLAAELGLERGDAVLDLAAGTGKLTRALRGYGLGVIAVEPLAQLRAVLEPQFGAGRVRAGVAEAIPMPDASVAAVTVADAFHWFDHTRALGEIARVLRADGGLAGINTIPDWRGASWGDELGQEVMRLRPEHPNFDRPPWHETLRELGGWAAPREVRVTVDLPAEAERIVDHLASMSWIAALPDAERTATLRHMRAVIDRGQTPAALPVHFVITLTRRLG